MALDPSLAQVFPARAGMSPRELDAVHDGDGVPRANGDEPNSKSRNYIL